MNEPKSPSTPENPKKPDARKDDKGGREWLISIGLAGVLWLTNPSSLKHGTALGVAGLGTSAFGWRGRFQYNNYLLFSTVSVKGFDGSSRTVSFGILGFVKRLE